MPRRELSKEGRILAFFRTAPLEQASLVFNLSRDIVSERRAEAVADAKAADTEKRRLAQLNSQKKRAAQAGSTTKSPARPSTAKPPVRAANGGSRPAQTTKKKKTPTPPARTRPAAPPAVEESRSLDLGDDALL